MVIASLEMTDSLHDVKCIVAGTTKPYKDLKLQNHLVKTAGYKRNRNE